MLTVTRSGPLGVQSMQLALFPDDASAARAWAGFREVVVACSLGRPRSGPSSRGSAELWTAGPLALGSRGLVAVGRYRLDGRPVSGNAHAAAVQVGNAVYLRVDYRDGLPGEPDPAAAASVRAAAADVERVCGLVGGCG